MIEVQLPENAPADALDTLREVIRKHGRARNLHRSRGRQWEHVAVTVGERRVELGDMYLVTGDDDCLADLMGALDAFQ